MRFYVELLCQKHDFPHQDDSSEGWGTTARKHNEREAIETTGAEVALLTCCMHSECNSSIFCIGSTPSKVHEQQEHLKFITFVTECCFFTIQIVTTWITCQILEGHLQHPISGASTTYVLSIQHLVKLFSCYHRTKSPCGHTSAGMTANIINKCYDVCRVCSSIPMTLKDFIKPLPYVFSSLSEPLA